MCKYGFSHDSNFIREMRWIELEGNEEEDHANNRIAVDAL